jgi:hypothetical protein
MPNVVPTQPPIQRVLGTLLPELKRLDHEAHHSLSYRSEEMKTVELYLCYPIRLHCVVLNKHEE